MITAIAAVFVATSDMIAVFSCCSDPRDDEEDGDDEDEGSDDDEKHDDDDEHDDGDEIATRLCAVMVAIKTITASG